MVDSKFSEAMADTEFQITCYNTTDGLCSNTIRRIVQSADGKLWLATTNGLACFDKKEFRNYYPSLEKDKVGLHDRRVINLLTTRKYLWVYHNGATPESCVDLSTGEVIDAGNSNMEAPPAPPVESASHITDQHGRTWEVTPNDGLYIINNKGEKEHYTTASHTNTLPTNALKCIAIDNEGVIWIGTEYLGLMRIDVLKNEGTSMMLEGENIRTVTHLGDNTIAVANMSGDVWTFDKTMSRQLSHERLSANTYCIFTDKDGNTWRGMKGSDVITPIYTFAQDKQERMWIGTFGEGLQMKHKESTMEFLKSDFGSKRVRKLLIDEHENIWAATSNGIYIFNPDELIRDSSNITHINIQSGHLHSNEIRTIFIDSRNNLYIAETGTGFAVIPHKAQDNIRSIQAEDILHFSTTDSLVNPMVQCFAEDQQGYIWISTEMGMSRFNPSTLKLSTFFFSKNMVNNIFSENCGIVLEDGRLLFGTHNGLIFVTPSVYSAAENANGINVNDITLGSQTVKNNLIYVPSHWWRSPWAIFIYILIAIAMLLFWRQVKRNNQRFHSTISKLNTKSQRLSAEKEVLTSEKEQLVNEKEVLTSEKKELQAEKEELRAEKENMEERFTSEIKIRREENINAEEQEFISRIQAIASAQISNADFSADDFANEMQMGRTVFFRQMKQIMGYSPKEYLKIMRMKRAAELIATTSLTIAQIANKVGIEDPLYLSRIFKAQYGCTPSEWRSMSKK